MASPRSSLLLLACLVLAGPLTAHGVLLSKRPGNVLTLLLTDCAKYQDWQTIAAAFAWRRSSQPGALVRVANCNPKDTAAYDKAMLEYVDTLMVPQYAYNEELKDWYAAYNKPGAVVEYFKHRQPQEEWVVVLDSDMLMHRPFLPEELNLTRGWAYAAHYDYLKGVDNPLALRHVPEVAPRNDTLGGPKGRRGDRVGGPYYMHRDDLSRLAPQWLNYTRIMRTDMEAYADSGDTASKKGDRIWIAEMYGYSFGAAKSDVWHIHDNSFMLYPSYTPSQIPHVMHYGLIYKVDDWGYDKHWYFDFDSHKCPPWDLSVQRPKYARFPPPPYPDQLRAKDYLGKYRDLLATGVIASVNAALCDYHVRNCPQSAQLTEVCNEAFKLYHAIDQATREAEWSWNCTDHNAECGFWHKRGECSKSKDYMRDHCAVSCGYCTPRGPRPRQPEDEPLTVEGLYRELGVQIQSQAAGGVDSAGAAAPPPAAAVSVHIGASGSPAAGASGAAGAPAAPGEKVRIEPGPAAAATAAGGAGAAAATQAPASPAAAVPEPQPAGEAALRAQYPASSLGYAALVKRCTDLADLPEQGLRDCIKAASLKLLFPGSPRPGSAAAALDAAGAALAGAGSAAAKAAGASDLAALHALHTAGGRVAQVEDMLSRRLAGPDGGRGLLLLVGVVAGLCAAAALGYRRWARSAAARAKAHSRSE